METSDTFAHMADDLEQNMHFNGDDDLDLFGFCSMIEDDSEELERRMGESESDSPMSLGGASFTSSENSPSLKVHSIDEDISPSFFAPTHFFEDYNSQFKSNPRMEQGQPVAYNVQNDSKEQKKLNKIMREYEINKKKSEKPVYIHHPNSVIVDHGFIKYELEIPNNPDYHETDVGMEDGV